MSRVGVVTTETGELQVFDADTWSEIGADFDMTGRQTVTVPDGFGSTLVWKGGTFVTAPRYRTSAEIYALFTPAEKAAIHGSSYGQVQGLISALLFAERVDLDSTFHQQGVALLAGLGLLSQARATQVLAGEMP